MNPAPPARLPRWPFVVIGLMTTLTILGPILIGWVLSGGASAQWPPDRPVEWVTLLGTSGAVLALMVVCLSLIWTNRQPRSRPATVESSTGVNP